MPTNSTKFYLLRKKMIMQIKARVVTAVEIDKEEAKRITIDFLKESFGFPRMFRLVKNTNEAWLLYEVYEDDRIPSKFIRALDDEDFSTACLIQHLEGMVV